MITFDGLTPGRSYIVRVMATVGSRSDSQSVRVTIPSTPEACTVNFINKGITVIDGTATVEFGGAGPVTGFTCNLNRLGSFTCKLEWYLLLTSVR